MRQRLLTGIAAIFVLFSAGLVARQAAAPVVDSWEADIQKFEEQDRQTPPPQDGVVFIGSSSILRWNLPQSFPDLGVRAINRGFGGSVMADAARYVDRIVVPYKPRLVVLYEGDNDLMTTDTPEQIAAQFTTFLDKVHAGLPDAKVIAIGVKPSVKRWAMLDKGRAINALMRAEANTRPYVTYVDVETPMLTADGQARPELYVEDGLHMSAAGYRIWDAAVRPLLR